MQIKELQKRVLKFEEIHQLESTPEIRVLDLLSELGEIAKEKVADISGRAVAICQSFNSSLKGRYPSVRFLVKPTIALR